MGYDGSVARATVIGSILATLASASLICAAADPIISAEFYPGGTSNAYEWRTNIFSDGRIEQVVKAEPGWGAPEEWEGRAIPALSRKQLDRFFRIADEVGFCSLEAKYSATYQISESPESWRVLTDQDTLVLTINRGGFPCRVEVYGAEDIAGIWKSSRVHPKKQEGQRFCKAWSMLLALAPAPNRWQKPKLYR